MIRLKGLFEAVAAKKADEDLGSAMITNYQMPQKQIEHGELHCGPLRWHVQLPQSPSHASKAICCRCLLVCAIRSNMQLCQGVS